MPPYLFILHPAPAPASRGLWPSPLLSVAVLPGVTVVDWRRRHWLRHHRRRSPVRWRRLRRRLRLVGCSWPASPGSGAPSCRRHRHACLSSPSPGASLRDVVVVASPSWLIVASHRALLPVVVVAVLLRFVVASLRFVVSLPRRFTLVRPVAFGFASRPVVCVRCSW